MRILGIISGRNDPASRFRIAQYAPYFASTRNMLNIYCPTPLKYDDIPPGWAKKTGKIIRVSEFRIWNTVKLMNRLPILFRQFNADIIWQNRLLLNTYFSIEKYYKRPLAFDIDDAIWLNEGENAVKNALKKATLVITGNEYLASYARKINNNTYVVPTSVDTNQLFPLPGIKNRFTIGWIGTPSNFRYLESVKKPVQNFLAKNEDAQLVIVSSAQPGFLNFDNKRIIFRKWSLEKENEYINSFSAGLMPLFEEEWAKGKCSCKMLQYLACGVPVIASPVGQNDIILKEQRVGLAATDQSDWESALHLMKTDSAMMKEMSTNGVNLVTSKYSCIANSRVLLNIFNKNI